MNLLNVDDIELFSVLQKTSLVNVKFSGNDNYIAVAVLYSNQNLLDVLIDLKKSWYIIQYGEEVQIKFLKGDYQFILDGEITEVTVKEPATATIRVTKVKKYLNKRRFIRYETNEDGELFYNDNEKLPCKVMNLSLGGAMVSCERNISKEKEIFFKCDLIGNYEIGVSTHIVRSIELKNGGYSFALEFEKVDSQSEMILRKVLLDLEKGYIKNLGDLKQISRNNLNVNTPIVVFDLCMHEDLDVKEVLGNLGIGDYIVFHDFKVYTDFFMEENPRLIIIDADEITDELLSEINNIKASFLKLSIILVLPMQTIEAKCLNILSKNCVDLVFKPFIYNEFENVIVKHL